MDLANEQNPPRRSERFWRYTRIFLLLLLIVLLAILLGLIIWIAYIPGLQAWDLESGTLGDAFGYWNSIFSGLALLGVVVSIFLQSRELRAQQAEMRKTAEALEGQLKQQKKDNFEATFFRLLEVFHRVAAEVRLPQITYREQSANRQTKLKGNQRGIEAFDFTVYSVNSTEMIKEEGVPKFRLKNKATKKNEFFEMLYNQFSAEFGQYYRLLFNLLELIDEAELPDSLKKRYANIVRAGLGRSQTILLALNCASKQGQEKMHLLVKKYRLLKYAPGDLFRKQAFSTELCLRLFGTEVFEPKFLVS